MDIKKQWNESNNIWNITLKGEIDIYNVPEFKEILLSIPDEKEGNINIDCTDLTYIDSTGLGVLISMFKRVKEYEGSIKVTNLKPHIAKILVPVLGPAGLGFWQIGLSLIAGLAAKEVVVSSMGILFGIANVESALGLSAMQQSLAAIGFGALNAYSMMIFVLFYTPCVAALAVIGQELKSIKWTALVFAFQLVFAWLASILVYQIVGLFI